jgi:hypothetical protein
MQNCIQDHYLLPEAMGHLSCLWKMGTNHIYFVELW